MTDRGLRAVVGELVEHVRYYDIPDGDQQYAAFIDAWSDRIHAASGAPRMQQQMAEQRKEAAAEAEALRAALERLSRAMYSLQSAWAERPLKLLPGVMDEAMASLAAARALATPAVTEVTEVTDV